MVEIVQKDHPSLREKAKIVPKDLFADPMLQKILTQMKEALAREIDGVAIAAPQINVPYRIFVISGKIFKKKNGKVLDDIVFINPVIIKKSRETAIMDEGCLSVRWYYGLVKRAKKSKIKALNEKGNEFVMEKSGLLSQISQHETDHLDGILFTDKAKNLVELPPEKQSANIDVSELELN